MNEEFKKHNDGGNWVVTTYDSVEDIAREMTRNAYSYRVGNSSDRPDGREGWYGSKNMEDAIDIFVNDKWLPAGSELIAKNVEHLFNKFIVAQQYTFIDEPGILDVGEYLTGSPDYWLAPFGENAIGNSGEGKSVSILVNLSVSCAVEASKIVKGGTIIFALIEILNAKNIPTRLITCNGITSRVGNTSGSNAVNVLVTKDYNQELNSAKAAFTVGHPSYFRRIGFRSFENIGRFSDLGQQESQKKQTDIGVNWGYGYPLTGLDKKLSHFLIGETPDIIINAQTDFTFTDDGTKWVEEQLYAMGIIDKNQE